MNGAHWQPKSRAAGDTIKCTVIENYKPATKNVKRNAGEEEEGEMGESAKRSPIVISGWWRARERGRRRVL